MAYFMVHLCIAQTICETQNIEDKGAFALGSVAPDAVAFNPGRAHADKNFSHFFTGCKWGDTADYDEWRESLVRGLSRYAGQMDRDFLYGYFAHVMTDIETNRLLYGPVRDSRDAARMAAYHKDCAAAEAVFLSKIHELGALWPLLHEANRFEMPEFFTCKDVNNMIDHMQNDLYADMSVDPGYRANIYGMKDFFMLVESTLVAIHDNTRWFDQRVFNVYR